MVSYVPVRISCHFLTSCSAAVTSTPNNFSSHKIRSSCIQEWRARDWRLRFMTITWVLGQATLPKATVRTTHCFHESENWQEIDHVRPKTFQICHYASGGTSNLIMRWDVCRSIWWDMCKQTWYSQVDLSRTIGYLSMRQSSHWYVCQWKSTIHSTLFMFMWPYVKLKDSSRVCNSEAMSLHISHLPPNGPYQYK